MSVHPAATTNRRDFLSRSVGLVTGLGLAGLAGRSVFSADEAGAPILRIGLVTDIHYADRPPAGSRYYRDSLVKLAAAGDEFARAKTDLVVELGDFIDTAETLEAEQGFLRRINAEYQRLPGPRYYVLGNHCVFALTKAEFLDIAGFDKSYYSFDHGNVHFVMLDGCFRGDGTPYGRKNFTWTDSFIPPDQLEWLRQDLATGDGPALVFVHQCLDVEPPFGVKNASQVRQTLEASGRVKAVFQGHNHRGAYRQINGIHYCTLRAMIEGPVSETNAFSILEVLADGRLRLTGFGAQPSLMLGGDAVDAKIR